MLHMNPDLMRAAGFKMKANQAVTVRFGKLLVVRDGLLTCFPVDLPLYDGTGSASNGSVNGAGGRCEASADDSKIFQMNPITCVENPIVCIAGKHSG